MSIEEGANIVNIAQLFQRSGTLQVSFADAGIEGPDDLAGKTVGNWGFGNEFELLAGLRQAGLDPASDVTLVQQNFDMLALLSREIDAAQAMTYNEYAQVLETVNPDTGELYQPEDCRSSTGTTSAPRCCKTRSGRMRPGSKRTTPTARPPSPSSKPRCAAGPTAATSSMPAPDRAR